MEAPVLRATRRSKAGKGVARKIRAQGLIPAVLYGGGENIPLSLQPKDLESLRARAELMPGYADVGLGKPLVRGSRARR